MGKQAIGKTKGGFNTKIHMICTDENNPVIFSLSPGNSGDAPCGRELIKKLGKQKKQRYLLMDKAYEGDDTRFLAQSLNFKPIVPPLNLIENLLGILTKFCINRATKLNVFFEKLSVLDVFLLAMTNSILFSFSSFTSLSFLILYFVLTGTSIIAF